MFVDVTFPNKLEALAKLTGHLTPALLREQIIEALTAGLSVPRMVAVHISVPGQEQVIKELKSVAAELRIDLSPGFEEMVVGL